ncbi:Methyltransferase domain-containing protein [Izhakiella capsodis]|uniref:Methyltransferase domain-containing protein n=1 Tax=Izhakiella capsodis TaxID=1367852 RepID=A0A1I4YMI9_9GAMM|nr:class I SAM-dependent methyltransferase [Izhakiella capsodis]SFN39224.1 Methyltransferase domain-containing protein [Izhakiella capsodis]
MATQSHHDNVDKQFGAQADAYLSSTVHSRGDDLVRLAECLSVENQCRLLDLGCGAGHASYVAAQYVRDVVAYDLSMQMLAVVKNTAQERGYNHLTTVQGYAEMLPFEDASFDVVISRYSAHHWHDVGSAMREVHRVLKPRGKVIFIDISSSGYALNDVWLSTIEALRDTSHVRNYAPREWLTLFAEAGLKISTLKQGRIELAFSSWVARMRTPEAMVNAIRIYQDSASDEVKDYFLLQPDGSFSSDTIFIEAMKA